MSKSPYFLKLATPRRRPAVQALVAGAVADHQGAAFEADGGVTVLNIDEGAFLGRLCYAAGDWRRGLNLQGGQGRFFDLDAEGSGFFRGQELRREVAEDVIHDRFCVRDLRIRCETGGLEARVAELIDEDLQWNPVLQRHRAGCGEAVHDAGKRRSFLGHHDENLAGGPVLVLADGEIAFVAGHAEFMRERVTLDRKMAADGTALSHRSALLLRRAGAQRLCTLGAIAIHRYGLEAQAPALDVCLLDLLH